MKLRNEEEVRGRVLLFALLTVLLLWPAQAKYEENIHEGIFLVRPDNSYIPERTIPSYLSGEDLTFFACVEYQDVPVRLSLLCEENSNFLDVQATPWGTENCYVGSVNLNDFPCNDVTIAADYIHNGENQRITQDVKVNRVTGALQRLLDTQFADGGWSSPLDTAFALFSIKPFEDVFDEAVTKGLAYLKEFRSDAEKCWPKDQCQVSSTAAIAYLLTQAGYEDDLRIVHDSTIYLEQSMSYIESGESWTLRLEDHSANQNISVNTSCVYGYQSDTELFNLSKYGTETNFSLTPAYQSTIDVVCTESIYADVISSVRGSILHYEGDNFTYTIPGPCWTYNTENVTCDLRTTAYAIGTPIDETKRDAAASYLATLLSSSVTGVSFSDADVMNLAIYFTAVEENLLSTEVQDGIVKHLLFRQSNDGNWNASRMHYNYSFFEPQLSERVNRTHVLNDSYSRSIVYTGYAVQALLDNGYERQAEVIEDAERWLSLHEQDTSLALTDEEATNAEVVASHEENVSEVLSDPKRNGMALFVLQQHTRPFITSSPRVIVLDTQNVTLDLVNPTTFSLEDLSYELSAELVPYVSVEEKDYLAPYSFRRITLRQRTEDAIDEFGYLRIMQGSDEYAKIPLIIEAYPELQVTFPTELIVFGSSTVAPLNITKSAHNFSCTLRWRDAGITSISSLTITEEGLFNLPLQFVQASTEQKDYGGVLTCSARSSTFTFPFTLRVSRFLTKPLSVSPSMLSFTSVDQELSITLKNLLDESIDVTLGLRDENDFIDFSDPIVNMYPGETRNVTVFITAPTDANLSIVNAVVIKTFNLEERVLLEVEILNEQAAPRPLWLYAVAAFAAIAVLGGGGFLAYRKRKEIYAWYRKRFKKASAYREVMSSVEEYERKEMALAIRNMVQILKMEGISDKDIRARLIEHGFTEGEITEALKMKDDVKPSSPTAPRK